MAQRQAEKVRALRNVTPGDTAPVLRRREQLPDGAEQPTRLEFPSVSSIEGELIQFDCLEDKARIHIRTSTETVALAIADPSNIVLIDNSAQRGQFSCGEQTPRPVRVDYDSTADEEQGTIGIVRQIEFKASNEN